MEMINKQISQTLISPHVLHTNTHLLLGQSTPLRLQSDLIRLLICLLLFHQQIFLLVVKCRCDIVIDDAYLAKTFFELIVRFVPVVVGILVLHIFVRCYIC